MQSAVMKAYIHAPIEKVWEALSDHEGYPDMFTPVTSCRLLEEGKDDRNGVGAVREIFLGKVRFVEDIVVFDPPNRLEYRVKECTIPMKHELGRIDLIDRGEGTEIHWVTTFHVTIPIIGGLLDRLLRYTTRDTFYDVLLELKDKLE